MSRCWKRWTLWHRIQPGIHLSLSVLLTYYNHSLIRFGAGVVQVVKLVAQQMLLRIRIRIGVTPSNKPD